MNDGGWIVPKSTEPVRLTFAKHRAECERCKTRSLCDEGAELERVYEAERDQYLKVLRDRMRAEQGGNAPSSIAPLVDRPVLKIGHVFPRAKGRDER